MTLTVSGRPGSTGNYTEHKDEAVKVHFLDLSCQDGMTALAGGAQAGTSLANYAINRFTTVATGSDSAQLPAAIPGRMRIVINAAASNALAVFPQSSEIINALTADSAFSVAANKTAIFFCAVAGTWNSLLTA